MYSAILILNIYKHSKNMIHMGNPICRHKDWVSEQDT